MDSRVYIIGALVTLGFAVGYVASGLDGSVGSIKRIWWAPVILVAAIVIGGLIIG